MKSCALLVLLGLTAAAPLLPAATNVSYTATADPNTSPDGIDNQGTATDVWTLGYNGTGTSPANYGSFLGNSGGNGGGSGAGAGTSAWGLYASGVNGTNEVSIGHTLTGGMLSLGQSVSIAFDGGYVDNGNSYGIRLYGPSGFVLALSFAGGDTAYRYYDGTTSGNSAGFGYDPNGFVFRYTQISLTTYSAQVIDGSGTLGSWTGTVSGAPDFIQVYNGNAGSGGNYDVFANNLAVVPEPRVAAFLGLGLGLALLGWRRRLA